MHRLLGTGGLAALLLTTAAPSAHAVDDTAPPGGKVTVDVVTVNGSGCPAGTARVSEKSDNTGFTVSYSDYTAESGGGAPPTDFRKNCQLSLLVHVPQGFTYAIARADYQGYARLESGTTGTQEANYYFQGDSGNNPVSHTIHGAYDGGWHFTDTADIAALVYQPCGVERGLNINTSLRVAPANAKAGSSMTMDSTRASVNTIYQFSWKQCP